MFRNNKIIEALLNIVNCLELSRVKWCCNDFRLLFAIIIL